MRKTLVFMAILSLAALMVFGCTKNSNDYQTGYAAYGQPTYQGGQPAVGGGCAVAGPDNSEVPDFEPSLAA